MINPFLNSRITANHDKAKGLSAKWWNPYKGDCFSIVESLLGWLLRILLLEEGRVQCTANYTLQTGSVFGARVNLNNVITFLRFCLSIRFRSKYHKLFYGIWIDSFEFSICHLLWSQIHIFCFIQHVLCRMLFKKF